MVFPLALPTAAFTLASLYVLRRIVQFVTADCDMRTLRARLNPCTFRGRVAWVTGASSGIGAALAYALSKQGACLILTARRKDLLDKLAESLPCPPTNVYVLPLDLEGDPADLERTAASVADIFGRLDFVFNNAGISTRVSAADLDVQHVRRVMDLNFMAPVTISRACLPALRASPGGGGTIINTVTVATLVFTPLRSTYSASKAALVAYFKALNLEERNVRVINIHPGSVRTPIAHSAIAKDGKPFGDTDVNIEAGLEAARVADRMLAAVSAGLSQSWIARPKELTAARVSQAFPAIWEFIASRLADGYRKKIEDEADAAERTTARTS